jgi:hypothetical protein
MGGKGPVFPGRYVRKIPVNLLATSERTFPLATSTVSH